MPTVRIITDVEYHTDLLHMEATTSIEVQPAQLLDATVLDPLVLQGILTGFTAAAEKITRILLKLEAGGVYHEGDEARRIVAASADS
jgi:hypothetical protein